MDVEKFLYHLSLPQGSVQRCASMACRKPSGRCDLVGGRRSKAKPGWLLRMPLATPPGRRGRRRHPSSEQRKIIVLSSLESQHPASEFAYNVSLWKCSDISHHLANNDDFWSQLFVNGKDVNEAEGEYHVVHTQDISAKSV